MNVQKLLTGTIVGAVVALIMGYLIFGMALNSYMAENASAKAEPDMLWLIFGHLAYGGLLTYIFLQWANISTPVSGAKAGAIIALLGGLGFNWIWHGTSDMFPGGCVATLIDAAGGAVVWAIGGAAIGWVLGRGK
jgi:hypothetical protein